MQHYQLVFDFPLSESSINEAAGRIHHYTENNRCDSYPQKLSGVFLITKNPVRNN